MCLAIPMQIMDIHAHAARCNANGVERSVNLFLMQETPLAAGDFVMVHVGYTIQKITPHEARSAWQLHDRMLSAEQGSGPHA